MIDLVAFSEEGQKYDSHIIHFLMVAWVLVTVGAFVPLTLLILYFIRHPNVSFMCVAVSAAAAWLVLGVYIIKRDHELWLDIWREEPEKRDRRILAKRELLQD